MTIFEVTGCRATKMNIFFGRGEMGVRNTVFKFFPKKKPIPSDLNPKSWFWGHIFPPIGGCIGPIISKNNRVHPLVDSHQPCELHENRFKTATCIVRSHT